MKLYREVSPEIIPPRRKEISDYSISVIGVFSDSLIDYVYYNYHKEEWSFHDGDDLQTLQLKYWLEPIEITEEEIENIIEGFAVFELPKSHNRYNSMAKAILSKLKGDDNN